MMIHFRVKMLLCSGPLKDLGEGQEHKNPPSVRSPCSAPLPPPGLGWISFIIMALFFALAHFAHITVCFEIWKHIFFAPQITKWGHASDLLGRNCRRSSLTEVVLTPLCGSNGIVLRKKKGKKDCYVAVKLKQNEGDSHCPVVDREATVNTSLHWLDGWGARPWTVTTESEWQPLNTCFPQGLTILAPS